MTSANRRRELESQDASPVIAWLHRSSAFALIFLSATFTIWYRLDDRFMARARAIVGDMFEPVSTAIAGPAVGFLNGVSSIGKYFDLLDHVESLETDNLRIVMLEEEINRLESRLVIAEELARLPIETISDYLTLRVINDDSVRVGGDLPKVVGLSNLVDRKLIKLNAGTANGVRQGFPVISDVGLVGRVVWAGERTSTAILLYDTSSSIPALVEALSAKVTAKGTGRRDALEIRLADSNVLNEIQVGDRIVTSGQGEVFPPGILIGHIEAVDQGVLVKPAVDWDRLVHVRVLPKSGERRAQ